MKEMAENIHDSLVNTDIAATLDGSGSIGKRYARHDEVGTPYCITVDHGSIEDGTVTIRERDSTDQVRVKADAIQDIIGKLVSGKVDFTKLAAMTAR